MTAYLDHNATTPPHDDVLAAMAEAARTAWANPSSLHQQGRAARRKVEDARLAVAALAGVSERDVVFTSGGTEANNLGLERPFPRGEGVLVTSRLEHPSVVAKAEELADRGVQVVWLPVPRDGHLRVEDVAAALDARRQGQPCLVAVAAVHHETGAIQPIEPLVSLVRERKVELHVDAVQAAGRLEPARWWGADTTALAAHKLRGPKGLGALACRPGAQVRPILRGGAQERGLRPGTVDPVAAAGFEVAARRALTGPARYAALAPLRDRLEREALMIAARHGVVVTLTGAAPRAPHVAHLLVDGWAGDELVAALDLEGVCVSSGSACTAGTAEASPALVAMVGERAGGAVRASLGETSTEADVDAFLRAFSCVLGRAPNPSPAP
jgi:cysteine desulfurase